MNFTSSINKFERLFWGVRNGFGMGSVRGEMSSVKDQILVKRQKPTSHLYRTRTYSQKWWSKSCIVYWPNSFSSTTRLHNRWTIFEFCRIPNEFQIKATVHLELVDFANEVNIIVLLSIRSVKGVMYKGQNHISIEVGYAIQNGCYLHCNFHTHAQKNTPTNRKLVHTPLCLNS